MTCSTSCRHRKVKIAADGKSICFINAQGAQYVVIEVDGCLVKQSSACDRVVEIDQRLRVFVEFKGAQVDDAAEQISQSIEYFKKSRPEMVDTRAVIVCSRVPKFQARDGKLKRKFYQRHKMALNFRKPNCEIFPENLES
jgi:hypothetical protein